MKGTCLHEVVCKYRDEIKNIGECVQNEICKFFQTSVVIRARDTKPLLRAKHLKKRGRQAKEPIAPDPKTVEGGGVTEAAFRKAMIRINYLRSQKKLDENQERALEPMKGKHFKTLTDEQREQVVNIAFDKK